MSSNSKTNNFMNYCYYNTDHKLQIEQGESTACTTQVEGYTYCEKHKEEVYGKENPYSKKRTIKEMQARLKKMGSKAKNFKSIPLRKMSIKNLSEFRLEIKAWLSTHQNHEKYNDGLSKVKQIEKEMYYRGVVNPDGIGFYNE